MNGAGQVVCGALKQLNNPKNPWDFMGCQVASCFEALKSGCHERRVWCFHSRGGDGFLGNKR